MFKKYMVNVVKLSGCFWSTIHNYHLYIWYIHPLKMFNVLPTHTCAGTDLIPSQRPQDISGWSSEAILNGTLGMLSEAGMVYINITPFSSNTL